jgi:hypothetical protein
MLPRLPLRAPGAGLLALALLVSPARALVTLNDGTDHIYVTATASTAYDSNIFARAGGEGDWIYGAGLLVDYSRRAGWIGFDASVGVNASRFGNNTTQDFNDPAFTATFLKTGGHTTGSLNLSATRESDADALIGFRTQSWNYLAELKAKYPVIERYSVSGDFAYFDRVYDHPTSLTDLATYTAGTDLLYALTTNRDLVAGYQFRRSETSSNSSYDDHSFTAGLSGHILPKLTGSIRAGYEIRNPRGASTDGKYQGLTASGSVIWTPSRKLTLTGEVSRDTSVTADNQSVDTTAATFTGQYALTDRFSATANAGTGRSRFLGAADAGRHDEYFTWGTGLKYTMNEHLDASLAYLFDENWSTLGYSNFTRHTITLTLSSRW